MHSINGFAYNVDMIKARMPDAPVDSLDMLFKPEIVAKVRRLRREFSGLGRGRAAACAQLSAPRSEHEKPEDFKAAERLILSVRPYIRSFDSSEYMNGLPTRKCASPCRFRRITQPRARAPRRPVSTVNLAFTVPKEGANA
jgi:putrescine transport system substrate-binding protein